jgi:DNA-binding transcriptional LysR family regulator
VARELMDLLQAGELDLAIAPLPRQANPALVSRELFTDRLAVVADENHPLLRRRNLTLADLTDQQWLLPSSHVLIRQQIDAALHGTGLARADPARETDFGSTSLFDLVRGTECSASRDQPAMAPRRACAPSHCGLMPWTWADA